MSEGATRLEASGPVYYGSTSVILPVTSCGGLLPDADRSRATRAMTADPHARVRAVRVAYLEAQLRAGGPIEKVFADVTVRSDARGVRVDIEVEARVLSAGGAKRHRRV